MSARAEFPGRAFDFPGTRAGRHTPRMTEVRASRVVTPQGITGPAAVEVDDDGRIAAVREVTAGVPERTLAPGFIDLQVNGHDDIDVGGAQGSDWERLDSLLLAQGVTTWCPTLTTRDLGGYAAPLAEIAQVARGRPEGSPGIAGVHLEGPFLAPDHAGAHPREHLRAVDRGWLASLPPIVRLVTLAPELPGSLEAIAELTGRGIVVALGHSGADRETARAATDAGARLVTHVFNAMGPLHHRRPGLVGTALTDPRLAGSVLAALVHLHADVLSLVLRSKPAGGVVLVTDATAWRSPALESTVVLEGGAVRRRDGTLAGSGLTMDRAVANAVTHGGAGLDQAVAAASTTPASVLGLADRGRIEVGARADLVGLRSDLSVESVWVAGVEVYGDP